MQHADRHTYQFSMKGGDVFIVSTTGHAYSGLLYFIICFSYCLGKYGGRQLSIWNTTSSFHVMQYNHLHLSASQAQTHAGEISSGVLLLSVENILCFIFDIVGINGFFFAPIVALLPVPQLFVPIQYTIF